MKVKCKDDNVTNNGLTKNKSYDVISIEDCAGKLYKIIDDNGVTKRYSEDFFYKNDIFTIGQKWEIYYNPKNRNNLKFEIKAIIDDEVLVYKTTKDNYKLENISYLELLKNQGNLRLLDE